MTRRTVRLVERRTREVRLPAGEAAFLLAHASRFVEVVPAFRRGVYRVTARGHVGWFDTPTRRFAVAPKIPWPNIAMLLGLSADAAAGDASEPDPGLLAMLAREFAARLREVVRIGLVAGYRDRDTTTAFLRGKLRTADQLRDAAVRAFPDRFHVTESVLDLDTPWNRVPLAVAAGLMANPALPPRVRAELQDAILPLDSVPVMPASPTDFADAAAEPRAAHYRPLLDISRVIHDGFAAATVGEPGSGGFLIDLSRAFERFVAEALSAKLVRRPGFTVDVQPVFVVGPTFLQPDLLIRRRGEPVAVLDTKWKAPGTVPDAADLHQILAYATLTGARHVGLVYPGTRSARCSFTIPGRDTRVSLFRVKVVGTTYECRGSVARLAAHGCRTRG